MSRTAVSLLQAAALLAVSLVLGTMFGIWRGYNPAGFSPETFIEMHQSAVRGLNILLPAIAWAGILATLALGLLSRNRPRVRWPYLLAAAGLVIGGLITALGNQPINAVVMTWNVVPPPDWTELRDRWWTLHLMRLAVSLVAWGFLVTAIFRDRDA